YVYKIKFEATVQAEHVAKLHSEIQRERDAVAALRAEWAKLENPARIQGLAQRHLPQLHPVETSQFDSLDHLPERPPELFPPSVRDPIGAMIESTESDPLTGSVPAVRREANR
ncbi:MAG TPA: hypothetical protein VHA77_07005, partial [Xanthobacteraceae bacterium]|nr:hypothetical protein [Xanthobacteraceae bacterium]